MLGAAQEIGRHIASNSKLKSVSLFDLPLSPGHSWDITEREIPASHAGYRYESITGVALPAWEIRSKLDLLASPTFGATAAIAAAQRMIGTTYSASSQLSLVGAD